jgi:hypothetical protein
MPAPIDATMKEKAVENHMTLNRLDNIAFPHAKHRRRFAHYVLRNKSGSLTIFTALRRALSLVSNFAADRRPGSSSK